jgi:transketolase
VDFSVAILGAFPFAILRTFHSALDNWGNILHYDAQRPNWPERDRLILSKGHAAPALYAVLAEAGYFSRDLLNSLRKMGSPLEGHPNMTRLAGVEASTGSLGQGLSIGLGHALAARLDQRSYRVYVILGDGEIDEGQVWEAAMATVKYRVSNLTAILDYNRFQQTGPVAQVMPALEPLVAKWQAFGWSVQQIDGHKIEQVVAALKKARTVVDRPQLVIAHTHKGRGLTPFEKNEVNRKHGETLKSEEMAVALDELNDVQRFAAISGM